MWHFLQDSGFEFIHIVFTIRNCDADDLNDTINRMYRNFSRMIHDKAMTAFKGFIRFLEVTYNPRTGLYHPHLHVLGVVRKSYFTSRYYVKQETMVSLWRSYMRLSYNPSVHLGKADSGSIAEVAKYCVKPFDFAGLPWREELAVYECLDYALHGRRMIQTYGVIRDVMRALNIDDLDNDTQQEQTAPAYMDLVYNAVTRCYEFT